MEVKTIVNDDKLFISEDFNMLHIYKLFNLKDYIPFGRFNVKKMKIS